MSKKTESSYILLDSSTWQLLMRNQDSFSVSDLYERRLVPFLTKEVLLELMNVSEEKRNERYQYFRSVPMIATLSLGAEVLGSHFDLRCLEYTWLLSKRNRKIDEFVLEHIRPISGLDLVVYFATNMDGFINEDKTMAVSISQSVWSLYPDPKIRRAKLKDIPQKSSIDDSDIVDHVAKSYKTIYEKAPQKKLSEHDRMAGAELFAQHSKMAFDNMPRSGGIVSIAAQILEIPESQIDQEQTLEDLAFEIEYHIKLKQVSKLTGLDLSELKKIPQIDVATWQIEKRFRTGYEEQLLLDSQRPPEPSSISDKRLATFGRYFTVTVDKRTRDILKKIVPLLSSHLKFAYLPTIEDLKAYVQNT